VESLARNGHPGCPSARAVAHVARAGRNTRREDALDAALAYVDESGGTFIHPYEDRLVVAGQGTIGLELLEQEPDVGTVLIPIGGGGLALGIATALRALRPDVISRCSAA
jgi:threonine dehydratase